MAAASRFLIRPFGQSAVPCLLPRLERQRFFVRMVRAFRKAAGRQKGGFRGTDALVGVDFRKGERRERLGIDSRAQAVVRWDGGVYKVP